MSFGVPVIATAVGGVPEIIQNRNGIMVPANDPDVLAEAMIALLGDDSLRRTIGKNGKDSLFPRFAADLRARKIVNLYTELLSEHARSNTINQPT